MQKLVSIIIPVYNVAEYIERCIRSVFLQKYTQIECIIVDDVSSDDSMNICQRLVDLYQGPIIFRILHHNCNRGLSAARNTGMASANGDFIYFLDSDDEMTSECIDKLVSLTEDYPEAQMISGNFKKYFMDGHVEMGFNSKVREGFYCDADLALLLDRHYLPVMAWNKLIRRDFINRYGLSFKEGIIYEDRLWHSVMSKVINRIYLCKDVTYHYYQRPNSILTGSNKEEVGESYVVIYREILRNIVRGKEKKDLDFYVDGFCRCFLSYRAVSLEYEVLWKEYWSFCRFFGCHMSCLKLVIARLFSLLPGGGKLIQSLYYLRGMISSYNTKR